MKVSELSSAELKQRLVRGELLLDLAPFVVRLRSDVPVVSRDMALVYGEFNIRPPSAFADFHVEVTFEPGVRRWIKPLARFYYDGQPAETPLPAHQAIPMVEWGLNWCVAAHAHQYLIIHAAVLEKGGKALVLPAPPGSGKSTLCAGLVSRGWRLLSDELALYDMDTGMIFGMARPINLKNASIDTIKAFSPATVLTESVPDTIKGTVALMCPPADSVRRVREPATPAWIVLPKFSQGSPALLEPHSRAQTFILVAEQSFNYDIHGKRGFEAVGQMIDRAACFRFTYSDLNEAERIFDDLQAGRI